VVLLDRIDLQVEVLDVAQEDLTRAAEGEPLRSDTRADRRRPRPPGEAPGPAERGARHARRSALDEQGATMLKQAISRLGLSARGYHRVLKVARTIAYLVGARAITAAHVAEAIQYRRFDRAA
jgi:magnesium chelatase family protein